MSEAEHRSDRFEIPRTYRFVPWLLLWLVVIPFTGMAAYYLIHYDSVSPSTIFVSAAWLLIVAIGLQSAIADDGGLFTFLKQQIGVFSTAEWVQIKVGRDGEQDVVFGYDLMGREVDVLRVPFSEIATVSWNMGQASSMAQRDCDDWIVIIRFGEARSRRRVPKPWGDAHLVGNHGSRKSVDPFGNAFVKFLVRAGVDLQSQGDCSFHVPSSTSSDADPLEGEPNSPPNSCPQ